MATQIQYSISVSKTTLMYRSNTYSMRIKRITNVDTANLKLASNTGTIITSSGSKIQTYGDTVCSLNFGQYGITNSFPLNNNAHSMSSSVSVNNITDAILKISNVEQTINVLCSGGTAVNVAMTLRDACSFILTVLVQDGGGSGTSSELSANVPVSTTVGSTFTINNITSPYPNAYYRASLQSASVSTFGTTSGTSMSITVPSNAAISTSQSGTLTIVAYTDSAYSNAVAQRQYTVTIYAKSRTAPTFTSIIMRPYYPDNAIDKRYGEESDAYIQNVTGISITVSAKDSTGNWVSKYYLDSNSVTASKYYIDESTTQFIIRRITTSEPVTVTLIATDQYGTSASVQKQIQVIPYSSPVITNATAIRCRLKESISGSNFDQRKKQFVPDENGTYVLFSARFTHNVLVGETVNAAKMECYIHNNNSVNKITQCYDGNNPDRQFVNVESFVSDGKYALDGINANETYYIEFRVSDQYFTTTSKITVATTTYTLHFKNGGLGVAVGKVAQEDNVFQISNDWTPKWGVYQMPRIYFGPAPTGSTQPPGVPGLIWLKPKG